MEQYLQELEQHLKIAVEKLKQDIQGIRSNRPSAQLLEHIQVPCYGQILSIEQLGSLSVKPPREITVTVWDPTVVPAVAKAIQDAKIGLNPNVEGTAIRCFFPPLTTERREEFGKLAKKIAEEMRIRTRTERDNTNKKIKAAESEKTVSEDQAFKMKERIQKMIDETNQHIEALVQAKLKELEE